MASQLPLFPRAVFTVAEPLSLTVLGGLWTSRSLIAGHPTISIAGCVATFISTDWFIEEQIDSPQLLQHNDNARLVALQLGNAYGLLFILGVTTLHTTTELKVVRNYLWALWIADIGHIGITAYLLGYDRFMAFSDWNAMTWGNIGATAFLFLTRTAYLCGFFGVVPPPSPSLTKKVQ